MLVVADDLFRCTCIVHRKLGEPIRYRNHPSKQLFAGEPSTPSKSYPRMASLTMVGSGLPVASASFWARRSVSGSAGRVVVLIARV